MVSLSPNTVIHAITRLTNCSSYSSNLQDCSFRKSVISAIRCLWNPYISTNSGPYLC